MPRAPLLLAVLPLAWAGAASAPLLEQRVLPRHSVSGFSAGASIALNHLVAYSDICDGVGIIGGSPYGCNTVPDSSNSCSGYVSHPPNAHLENKSIPWNTWVDGIRRGYLNQRAASERIAALSNLVDKPVFLFSGLDDVWVYQSVMRAVADQFRNLSARVKTEFTYYAAHAWVVDRETCVHAGVQEARDECCGFKNGSTKCPLPPHNRAVSPLGCCGICSSGDEDDRTNTTVPMSAGWRPPINSCDYDLAGAILRWILGAANVAPRAASGAVVPSNLIAVQQAQFLPNGSSLRSALLDETGFVYVPSRCRATQASDADAPNATNEQKGRAIPGGRSAVRPLFSSACRIHVHYHPCGGGWRTLSLSYMLQNALPAYAETNDVVLLYPQSSAGGDNPVGGGCFDWFGATGEAFDTRSGVQINTVLNMMTMLREEEEVWKEGRL